MAKVLYCYDTVPVSVSLAMQIDSPASNHAHGNLIVFAPDHAITMSQTVTRSSTFKMQPSAGFIPSKLHDSLMSCLRIGLRS